jgi:glycosyltransferase involved in cell wall biosynthesis
VTRVGVVVPVHNEESTLTDCLRAIGVASSLVDVPVEVVVVLDACTDRSAAITHGFSDRGVDSIAVDGRSVGSARAAGMAELLRRHGRTGLWLATTDGDTLVPPNWLAAQLRHGESGARVVAGTVTVEDWGDRSDEVRRRARSDYDVGPHRHVHGANLSFCAAAYCAAGGFKPVPCHEDVQLVEAFHAIGEPVVWAADLPVVTSARRDARAPSGFGSYLSNLEASLREAPRAM